MEDSEIEEGLKRLHEGLGHAPRETMLRMLKMGNARCRALDACRRFVCADCPRHAGPKLHRRVRPKYTTHFGEEVCGDLLEVRLADGEKIAALNLVDRHTGFQICWPLFKPMSQVTSEDARLALELSWASWADLPDLLAVDQGREFMGEFAGLLKSHGIPVTTTGTEAHWQAGEVEIHGKVWKQNFAKMVEKFQIDSSDKARIFLGFTACNRARNNRPLKGGSAPPSGYSVGGTSCPGR